SEPSEHRRNRHRLLLKDRNPVRPPKNRLQSRMRVAGHFEPPAPACIWMHEFTLDRTGTNQRYLDDNVVHGLRTCIEDRGDLCSALDLESANGLATRDHVERRRVVLRQFVQLEPPAAPCLDRIECTSHQGERTQTEEVELRAADVIQIILVELNDRASHARMLDRQVIAEQISGKHET